jgi:hypothetical protein
LRPYPDSDIWRTKPEGVRSGPGDLDLMRYSLHKYLRLATAGNPSILVPLFAPPEHVLIATEAGHELRDLAPSIVSRRAGFRFLGYLESQRLRMMGADKQNRVPKRPELIEQYGFDTKYAGHAIRLGLQGIELMSTGRLMLPMSYPERRLVVAVRTGQFKFEECLSIIHEAKQQLTYILDNHKEAVPENPDYGAINEWMVAVHRREWKWNDSPVF